MRRIRFTRPAWRVLVVGVVLVGAAAGARFANPSEARARFSPALACGAERWNVKTLADRPALQTVRRATIARLAAVPAPRTLPATRLPFEHHVFGVNAAVVLVRPESDSDLHVVLSDGRRTMIAEATAPACAPRAAAVRHLQIGRVRQLVRVCPRATVTGVAFFDFPHGQTGMAPNAIELHPILGFRCLSIANARLGPPGG